jgi:hypothetical protein
MRKIIDLALTFVGYKESPDGSNRTKFGEWFGLNGESWCGIFVSYCYAHCGVALGSIDYRLGFAGCPYAVKAVTDPLFMKANPKKVWGKVITLDQAKPGDIVFFDWQGDGKWDHVALFKERTKEGFVTIDGNTSVLDASNGGEVMIRHNVYKNLAGARLLGVKCKIVIVRANVIDALPPEMAA